MSDTVTISKSEYIALLSSCADYRLLTKWANNGPRVEYKPVTENEFGKLKENREMIAERLGIDQDEYDWVKNTYSKLYYDGK